MLLRSMMFVPGHNRELLLKAKDSGADALIFDLEDSVPEGMKGEARQILYAFLFEATGYEMPLFLRVNDWASGHLLADIIHGPWWALRGFVYPKVESRDDIVFLDKLLTVFERDVHIDEPHFSIIPLIETCAAVLHVEEICRASERVIAVAFGAEDYAADLGIDNIYWARQRIAVAARACGVQPIDCVTVNRSELAAECATGAMMGYAGKLCVSPRELPSIHKSFSPTEAEVTDACEMIRLYEQAVSEGKGVAVYDGKFVGPPLVRAARKVLERRAEIDEKRPVNHRD